jgi:uncharacterized protein (TIGR00251 family)
MTANDPEARLPVLNATFNGVAVRVKAVPGASRTRLAGLLGDRLKITVAAPPEGGKANRAICTLLADVFSLPKRHVTVTIGQTQPLKIVCLEGIELSRATARLKEVI